MAGILQDAITLIKQGKKHEARGMLEVLLRTNPKEVANWLWYAETLETPEKRIKVLELCLKANPGNPQVEKALSILQAQLAAPPQTPAFGQATPAFDFNAPTDAPEPQGGAFTWEEQPPSRPAAVWEEELREEAPTQIDWDDAPKSTIDWDAIEQQQAPKATPAWEYQPDPQETQPEAEPPRPSYPFYDVWLTALTSSNEREYQALLLDPRASQSRAYEWMGYIGLISGLLLPVIVLTSGALDQPEFQKVLGAVDKTMLLVIIGGAGAILSCISAVLGLMINGGIQFLIAKALGGGGSYTRTVYALGAYLAPMTLISMIISAIPFVNCLSIFISIYALVLNVRALKAAHYMDTSRAVMVIFLPSILLLIVGCLAILFLAPMLGEALPSLP